MGKLRSISEYSTLQPEASLWGFVLPLPAQFSRDYASDLWLIRQLTYDLTGEWASSASKPEGNIIRDFS